MGLPTVGFYRVRKSFEVDGQRLAAGSIVDVTDWKNAYQLVDRGYLVAIPAKEKVTLESATPEAPISPPAVTEKVEPKYPTPCPKCGSVEDEACITANGQRRSRWHAGRK